MPEKPMHFCVGETVIEKLGAGAHSPKRPTTITAEGPVAVHTNTNHSYDRLTGAWLRGLTREAGHEKARMGYMAIHSKGYEGALSE